MSIDLHLHTQASDGTITAEHLVSLAANMGLSALSITDHDAVDSLNAGASTAAKKGLTFIPGVEFSSSYTSDIALHILGYGIDAKHNDVQQILARNQAAWDKSEEDSILALEKLDIKISRKRHDYWKTQYEDGGRSEEHTSELQSRPHLVCRLLLEK